MPAPTISSRSPSVSETNVYLNKIITITFSEALLESTVTTSNFSLRHAGSQVNVKVSVSYNSTTYVVTLVPETQLWKNSTFEITVIGLSSALGTGYLKAADNTAFATTTRWQFQTGDDIDAPLDKSESAEEREGDLFLPPGLQLTQDADFQLVRTIPANGSWGFTGSDIYLVFNAETTTGRVATGVTVYQRPFLDEDGWFGYPTGDSYSLEWQGALDASYFVTPTWVVTGSATGSIIRLTTTGTVLANTMFEIEVSEYLTDKSGNATNETYSSVFTSHSYPNYVTPRLVRNELFSIYTTLNQEFVHQVVWKWMVNAYRIIGNTATNFSSKGAYLRDYVKYGAIMDIMQSLWIEKSMNAGIMKTLGDFIVEYDPKAGNLESDGVYKRSKERFEKAYNAIRYLSTQFTSFIKGWNDVTSPANFRTRLWKNPRVTTNGYPFVLPDSYPVHNTRAQRDSILPGAGDDWS